MTFLDMLKEQENILALGDRLLVDREYEPTSTNLEKKVIEQVQVNEAKKPEELLRKGGFKIKLITPTSFGTQIEFAKTYPKEELEDVLKDFNIKIKNKSVFIID